LDNQQVVVGFAATTIDACIFNSEKLNTAKQDQTSRVVRKE
jgi:hypothetical protein